MSRPRKPNPPCCVVSDSPVEAELVRSILVDEFAGVEISLYENDEFQPLPDVAELVLVLAFRELAKAQHYYLAQFRRGDVGTVNHRTVLLCTLKEAAQAYELCRQGLFDDYMAFWPVSADPRRVLLCVHQAASQLQVAKASSVSVAPATSSAIEYSATPRAEGAIAPSVLVVEDDPFQSNLISQMLRSEGYTVHQAVSGAEALSTLQSIEAVAVLLDIQLPDIDGAEIIRRIRINERWGALAIIMVTADGTRETVLRTRRLGAVDFIVKPIDRATLRRKLTRALSGGAPTMEVQQLG